MNQSVAGSNPPGHPKFLAGGQIEKAIASYKPQYKNLTDEIVTKIKDELAKGKLNQSQIAKKFGFRRETICRLNYPTHKGWGFLLQ